jgi:hypothetical protein
MGKESYKISFEDKTIVFTFLDFDTDVDVDDLTRIHHENIMGEKLTISTLLNKIGMIKAAYDAIVRRHQLEVDIYKAEVQERIRKELTFKKQKKDGTYYKPEKPGQVEVDNNTYLDPVFQNKLKKQIRLQKEAEMINSLYWAVQSKDQKLKGIIKEVTPKEFEEMIIEGEINSIFIKKVDNLIPSAEKHSQR